jgi:uncharacterized protein YodC (DUF2158 family)
MTLPLSRAARIEAVKELLEGIPVYCTCSPDCHEIIDRHPPLITPDDARRLLDFPEPPKEDSMLGKGFFGETSNIIAEQERLQRMTQERVSSEIGQYSKGVAPQIVVGSVVRLKSGSPDIVVTGLASDATGDRVTGIWYAKQSGIGKFEQVGLPRCAVDLVKP